MPNENVAPKHEPIDTKKDLLDLPEILSGLNYIEISHAANLAEDIEAAHPHNTSKNYLEIGPAPGISSKETVTATAILLFIRRAQFALSVALSETKIPEHSTLNDIYKNTWPVYQLVKPLLSLTLSIPRYWKDVVFADYDLKRIQWQYDALLNLEAKLNIEPKDFTLYSMTDDEREELIKDFKRPDLISAAAPAAMEFQAKISNYVSKEIILHLCRESPNFYSRTFPEGFQVFINKATRFSDVHLRQSEAATKATFNYINIGELYEVVFLAFFNIDQYTSSIFSERANVRPSNVTRKFVV